MTQPQTLTIRRPDDWHVHLRDGDMLKDVVNYTARQFARAIIMPNLAPPVTTAVFIDQIMRGIVADFPELKIVFEHITTKDAADFVIEAGPNVAATITPQHLAINRNAIFQGGIRPHMYCLPIAKRELHRQSLRKAATSGNPKFFLGTDTAPHAVGAKESACGCAGIFNAPYALESYLKTFEEENALDKFEGFASKFGPAFYGLPLNEERVTLTRTSVNVPESLMAAGEGIIPFHAGEELTWSFEGAAA